MNIWDLFWVWEWSSKKDDSPLMKKILAIRDSIRLSEGSVPAASQKLSSWDQGGSICISKAYDFFQSKGSKEIWASDVWSSCITPKHAFILWWNSKSKLLTKDKCCSWISTETVLFVDPRLSLLSHIFFPCPLSSSVWGHIRSWLGITKAMSTVPVPWSGIKKEAWGSSWHSKDKRIALACTIYQLWTARNRSIFEGLRPPASSNIRRIKTHVYKVMFSLYPNVLIQFESRALGQ